MLFYMLEDSIIKNFTFTKIYLLTVIVNKLNINITSESDIQVKINIILDVKLIKFLCYQIRGACKCINHFNDNFNILLIFLKYECKLKLISNQVIFSQ